VKLYQSRHVFKQTTHHEVPGWGQGIVELQCPVCRSLDCDGHLERWGKREKGGGPDFLGRCRNCGVRIVRTKEGSLHVYIPPGPPAQYARQILSQQFPEGIPYQIARITNRSRNGSSNDSGPIIDIFLIIEGVEVSHHSGFKRSGMRRMRKSIRARGLSIRNATSVEETERTIHITFVKEPSNSVEY
jgi:hypothetical protein